MVGGTVGLVVVVRGVVRRVKGIGIVDKSPQSGAVKVSSHLKKNQNFLFNRVYSDFNFQICLKYDQYRINSLNFV